MTDNERIIFATLKIIEQLEFQIKIQRDLLHRLVQESIDNDANK